MPAYSRILLPWDSQPQEVVEVDRGNPLTAALKSAVYAGSGALYDAATGRVAAMSGFTGTATSGFVLGENGRSLAFDGTNDYSSFDSYSGTPVGGGFTIAARLKRANITTNQRIVVIRKGGVSYQLAGYGSSLVGAYTAGSGLGGASPAVGVWATVFAEFNAAGAAVGAYVNDGPLLNTGLGAGADATVDQYNIGAQDGANRFNSGEISSVFVWDRALTAGERAEIYRNPWSLFTPRTIWVPVSSGGGGTATDLTVADATHSHTADSPTITVTTSTDLTIADATHAHAADSLTLSIVTVTDLTIADAAHAHTADAPTLTLGYIDLTIADALHGHTADSLTLAVDGSVDLVIDDALHGHTADSITLEGLGADNAGGRKKAKSKRLSWQEYDVLMPAEVLTSSIPQDKVAEPINLGGSKPAAVDPSKLAPRSKSATAKKPKAPRVASVAPTAQVTPEPVAEVVALAPTPVVATAKPAPRPMMLSDMLSAESMTNEEMLAAIKMLARLHMGPQLVRSPRPQLIRGR